MAGVHTFPVAVADQPRKDSGEIVKICPRSASFSLRFFKSDRLLALHRRASPC